MQNYNTVLIQREALRLLDEDRLREALDFMYSEGERAMTKENSSCLHELLSEVADLLQELESLREEILGGQPMDQDRFDRLMERAYVLVDKLSPEEETRRPEYYSQLIDETQPLYLRCYLMSQLTFHLLKHFDGSLTEGLYLFTLDDQPVQLRVRAWVAIALVSLVHHKRISRNPRLQEQLSYIAETIHDREQSNLMMGLQLLLLQTTDAIRAKELLRTTIQQMVLKFAQHNDSEQETGGVIKTSKEKNPDGKPRVMTVSLNLSDQNNAWLHSKDGQKLRKEVAQYISLIGDGADGQLENFEGMAQTPFFSEHPEHWLEPFSLDHPDVAHLLNEKPELEKMIQSILRSDLCDTDKFVRMLMLQNFRGEMLEMLETLKETTDRLVSKLTGKGDNDNYEANMTDSLRAYMHDLFRYCLYSGQVSDEDNPFHGSLLFLRCPELQASIDYPEELQSLSQYLMDKERWEEALEVLNRRLEIDMNVESATDWIRAASMVRSVSDNEITGRLYQFADLYPESESLQLMLGLRLLKQQRWHEADLILRPASKRFPDNLDLLLALSHAQLYLGQTQESLDNLFRCDFLQENEPRVAIALATTLMCLGRHEEAERYIATILESSACDDEDLIIGGHIALGMGNLTEALNRYQRAWYKARRNKKGQKLATFIDRLFQTPANIKIVSLNPAYMAIARDTLYIRLQHKK